MVEVFRESLGNNPEQALAYLFESLKRGRPAVPSIVNPFGVESFNAYIGLIKTVGGVAVQMGDLKLHEDITSHIQEFDEAIKEAEQEVNSRLVMSGISIGGENFSPYDEDDAIARDERDAYVNQTIQRDIRPLVDSLIKSQDPRMVETGNKLSALYRFTNPNKGYDNLGQLRQIIGPNPSRTNPSRLKPR